MIQISDEYALDRLSAKVDSESYYLRLFSNDVTPSKDDTISTYTEASSTGGYAQKTLAAGSWTVAMVDDIPTATYAKQVFSYTGAGDTVYGYYLVRVSDGMLVGAEEFSNPMIPTASGNHIDITPRLQDSGGTPS